MPFTPDDIKYLLLKHTGLKTLSQVAEAWGVRIQELSMCISQASGRIYPALRLKICAAIGKPVDEVFGEHPLTTALLQQQSLKRNAA